jgi:hypothetical protein
VIGDARADSQGGRAAFTFSCSVDLADGDVRSVDVQPARQFMSCAQHGQNLVG